MPNKIVVGITQRVDRIGSYDEWRDSIDQRMVDWVVQAGFVPLPIPNTLFDIALSDNPQLLIESWLESVNVGAILLSGGNDIGSTDQRDLTERCLLAWAEKNRKPVLGICRGMQMMGVCKGVELVKVDDHVGTHHNLQMVNSNVQMSSVVVNSYHNLALESCPDGFEILSKSEDGCIEAIKHKELPWQGWMWHPEREGSFSGDDQARFKRLIKNEK